ncbi:hypothetical protein [Oerskovia sp. Root22]|uniref:hypothetical protein n=1 Tax=Oerskovia sp. Root22 TaxID=1736494 RepID=UPI0006F230AE|nr:hypothetical protein [Oerskovia sp. Root22]KRC42722.1 hypothetical protein ASE15_01465 [Oerskovia sp. Root22]
MDTLNYLLGVDSTSTLEAAEENGDSSFTAEQLQVLAALDMARQRIETLDTHPDFSSMQWAEWLLQRSDGFILAHRLRALATGEEPIAPDTSTLAGCLSGLITDLYAGLVLPVSGPFGMSPAHNLAGAYYRHPLRETFEDLVMQDRDLKRIFPRNEEHTGQMGYTTRSTGQGGTIQLTMFAQEIIGAGIKLARFEQSALSPEQVAQDALRCLELIRSALRGEDVRVPVRVGLTGVLLPDARTEMDFGWARLRRADSSDAHLWAATSLDEAGSLTTTTEQGETVEISYRGDLILEFDAPYKMVLGERDISEAWPAEMMAVWDRFTEISESLRLGLLLADPDHRTLVVTTWQSVLDPISHSNGLGWADAKTVPNLMARQLTADDVDQWLTWSKAIDEHRIPTIGVAIRRMLMAVAERRNPEDVLVDAVVVWENLFGAKSETTLRIASSLALLLSSEEATATERLANQSTYKRLYALRSGVVHGAPNADLKKLQQGADDAVKISMAALREIFSEQVDLLTIKTSEDRSLHLIHRGDKRSRS